MAALTGKRLKNAILAKHKTHFHQVFLWLDSIHWIRSSNEKQPTFVANRVAEILATTTVDEWHHIQGTKNASDIGTRGISFEELSNSDWIESPEWLKKPVFLV